jgi:hypothetical protein
MEVRLGSTTGSGGPEEAILNAVGGRLIGLQRCELRLPSTAGVAKVNRGTPSQDRQSNTMHLLE